MIDLHDWLSYGLDCICRALAHDLYDSNFVNI